MRLKLLKNVFILILVTILIQTNVRIIAVNIEQVLDKNIIQYENDILSIPSYQKFLSQNAQLLRPDTEILIYDSKQAYSRKDQGIQVHEGEKNRFEFNANDEGLYNVELEYTPINGSTTIEYAIYVNGKIPFLDAATLQLGRSYKDLFEEYANSFDNRGNQYMPQTVEKEIKRKVVISDTNGYYNEPLLFNITKGKNTIELLSTRGEFILKNAKLFRVKNIIAFDEYVKKINTKSFTAQPIKIEAENTYLKSNTDLILKSDKSSAAISPNTNGKKIYNAIASGGKYGTWVEYIANIPADGFYYLDLKFKNSKSGMTGYKRILVDDVLLYKELGQAELLSSNAWQVYSTSGMYLKKGKRVIRIETVLAKIGPVLAQLNQDLSTLNEAYNQIIMYIGVNPDIYRSYNIASNLKSEIETFNSIAKSFKQTKKQIEMLSGQNNGATALLDRFSYELLGIVKKPELLPKKMDQLRSNLSALASTISLMNNVPVTLDYLMIRPAGNEKPIAADATVIENILNELKNFIYSFVSDYNDVGDKASGDNTITAWVTTGRDQAEVIKTITDRNFTRKTDIGVNIKLVLPTTLLSSIVSGINPDIALQLTYADPANYALRGSVISLNDLEGFAQATQYLSKSSLDPLTFNGKTYGLSETEQYLMMFYRKDILSQLKLALPQTWDDVVVVITELQKKNLYFGLPQGPSANTYTFGSVLLQNGASFYQKETYYTALNSEKSINAFSFITDIFVNYKLPIAYDFVTRFRIGEMPIAIGDISSYNSLQVAAPEIKGLWEMVPIPGMQKENGIIDRSTINTGTASMILLNSKKHNLSWKYLKWWVSEEAQTEYGNGIESILGPSAKYPTSNLKALEKLTWSKKNISDLNAQRKWVVGVEPVPGGYFTSRHIDNAFRKIVISGNEPRETLREYCRIINLEIKSKCDELGIDIKR